MHEANADNRIGNHLCEPTNDQGNGQRNSQRNGQQGNDAPLTGVHSRINYENSYDQEIRADEPRNRPQFSFNPYDSNCNRTQRILN